MCGIVGYAGVAGALPTDLLDTMRDRIAHRGPDASGTWCSPDGRAVLGHRRLSIIDLSPTGAQPMMNAIGNRVVIFNGEIYNHEELRQELAQRGVQFRGRSDTEVLLAAYDAWGEACVARLRGMFAFAIYDSASHQLFLARDRAGEKPLFWASHRQGLIFASELKALMCDPSLPRQLEPQSLAYYLSFGYVPGARCLLRGVNKLPPAHHLTWSLDGGPPRVQRYWELPPPLPGDHADAESLSTELQTLLESSVAEQLVADVPVAVLLSGGVDSSLVAALAAHTSRAPVRTFTVTLPGHPRLDEGRYARQVASYLRTDHTELPLDGSSVDLIQVLAQQYDEPIGDSSMIPTYLLARTVSQHCKVVLGGDGGDELFGGYLSYQSCLRRQRLSGLLPSGLRAALALAARNLLPYGTPGRGTLLALAGNMADGIAQSAVWADQAELPRLSPWLARQNCTARPELWRRDLVEPARGLPGAAMAADFLSYLPEDILVKVDRASMLCSLEVRAPFLDQRIIEFAYRCVPNELRATDAERKILLKGLARRLLPPQLNIDRKQGFTIPIAQWLTPQVISAWQQECQGEIAAVLAPAAVARLAAGGSNAAEHGLFATMMLTSWMHHYGVSA